MQNMNKPFNLGINFSVLFLSLFALVFLAVPVVAAPAAFPGCAPSGPTVECVISSNTVISSAFNNDVFQYGRLVIDPTVSLSFSPISDIYQNGSNITIIAQRIEIAGNIAVDAGSGVSPWVLNGGNGGSLNLIAKQGLFTAVGSQLTARGGNGSTSACLAGNGGSGGKISLRTVPGASVSLLGTYNVSGGLGATLPVADNCTTANGTNGALGVFETTSYTPSVVDFFLAEPDGTPVPIPIIPGLIYLPVGILSGANQTVVINAVDEFSDAIVPTSSTWTSSNSSIATIIQLNSTHVQVVGHLVGDANITVRINGVEKSFTVNVVPGELDYITVTPPSNTSLVYGQIATLKVNAFDAAGNSIIPNTYHSEIGLISFEVVQGALLGNVSSCLSTPSCRFANRTGGYPVTFQAASKPGVATLRITRGSQVVDTNFTISMPLFAVAAINLLPLNPTVTSGSSVNFIVNGLDADGDEAAFNASSWSVANVTGTANINSNGTLIAGLPGSVTVSATLNGLVNSTNVVIVLGQANHFAINGPTTVVAGQAIAFTALLQDQGNNNLSAYNGQVPQVVWSTSSGTIYPNATLVATTAGSVTVTATLLQNPAVRGTYVVLVTPGDVVGLGVAESGSGIQVGNTYVLTASLVDKYGNRVADTDATWTILNATGTATLSGRLITPTKVGYVTVYAVSLTNPALTATGVFTITAGQPTSITIAPPSASIRPGNIVTFSIQAHDAFGNSYVYQNTNASWVVSNTGIAVISNNGILTALGPGSVTVTATIGLVSKSVTVTVLESLDRQAQVAAGFSTQLATTTVPGQQPRVSINTGTASGTGLLSGFFTAGADSDMLLLGALALLLVGMVAYWISGRS
ncbi:MAG: Ig-like domain-containing protein [Candidatus Micrarchaeota archaeon]|nr:Ig-like domain-containing protein [Candidatus Micrarchaeota archaeon]